MTYAIRFDFPDGAVAFAGLHDGAYGLAPTLRTAELYDGPWTAVAVLRNGYGPSLNVHGRVVTVMDGTPVARA